MLSQRMKNLKPYVPGEQPQDRSYIKLNTNENPYPPSPKIGAFLKDVDPENLRRYPDPTSLDLRRAIAARFNLDPKNVFAGNGSDEVLSFTFYAFFDSSEGDVLFPEFTYTFYPVYCDFYGIHYQRIPLANDLRVRLNDYLPPRQSCGVILANPNAPIGIALPLSEIESFMEKYPRDRVVVIDEAYIDFGGQSAVPLIKRYANLLVIHTYSKSRSLAGIRLGFALGSQPLIDALTAVKDSFNSYPIDRLAQKIGEIAISDTTYYQQLTTKIISERNRLTTALQRWNWEVPPSSANFIFARKKGLSGKDVYQTLKNNGILVRYFDIEGIRDFVRITIGTSDEINALLSEIKANF